MENQLEKTANNFIQSELRLNVESSSRNLPIGSLLADYWWEQYQQSKGKEIYGSNDKMKIFAWAIKFIIKILFKRRLDSKLLKDKKILLGKSGNHNHLSLLVGQLNGVLPSSYVLAGGADDLVSFVNFFKRFILIFECIYIFLTISIKNKFHSLPSRSNLLMHLFFGVTRFYFFSYVLKKYDIKLIIVDFDRSKFAPLVLSGKCTDKFTVTLQHGVINPPYGYVPVLADKIFVWGELWKKLLVNLGTDPSKIDIVGSILVDRMNLQKKIDTKNLRTIGIGPNPIGQLQNSELWLPIINLINEIGYNVIVKLHPSMEPISDPRSIFGENCTISLSSEIKNSEFFDKIDLLLISTSGLGYEAIEYGVPVMVVREGETSLGNDYIMVHYGKFPSLDIENLKQVLENYKYKLDLLLLEERTFIDEQVYAARGPSALELIQTKLNKLI